MATVSLDLKGLKCPQPSMKVASAIMAAKPGDIIEGTADCSTFEDDVRGVCKRWNKVLLAVRTVGPGVKTIQIQV